MCTHRPIVPRLPDSLMSIFSLSTLNSRVSGLGFLSVPALGFHVFDI